MPIFFTDSGSFNQLEVTGSTILSGSLIVSGATNFGPSGLTGSLFGTSSIAQTASFVEFTNIVNRPTLISASTFTSPSQGTVRATINGSETDVDTGLQTGDSPQFTNLNISSAVTASIVSASTALTASNVRLNGLTDTTAANKVLVLNTTTNQILTTASVTTPAFPYDGRTTPAIISGSLILSSSQNTPGLVLTGSIAMVSGGAIFRSVSSVTQIQGNVISTDGNAASIRIRYGPTTDGVSFGLNNEVFPETNELGALGTSTQRWGSAVINQITGSVISASTALTASNVRLDGLVDTTAANKVLVLNTTTNQIFTTASVGSGFGTIAVAGQSNVVADQSSDTLTLVAGTNVTITTNATTDTITINSTGGSGNAFPYDGTVTPALISGSLIISSSNNSPLTVSGSIDNFFELEVVNASAGNNASADVVVSSNNTTDLGNYAAFGINSTTFNGPLVGGPSDGYLYLTSSAGEFHIGNATTGTSQIATSNVRLFAGGPSSDATTRIFISSSGNVGINTTTNLRNTLTVQGSVSASSATGSFSGSFSGSLAQFNPISLRLTVGTTAPTSPAVNDLWVDTN